MINRSEVKGHSLAIMQPYFFPYVGHFSLIAAADYWVVFDVSQYTKKSWMSRNRILHPTKGWMYISVSLSNASRNIKTSEAKVLDVLDTKNKVLRQLEHYKKNAPFFDDTIHVVEQCFQGLRREATLVELNTNILRTICEYLTLDFNYLICSDLNLNFPNDMGPGDWAPFISRELKAKKYINPITGSGLFNYKDFINNGIELEYLKTIPLDYQTNNYNFIENLSILDCLMWVDHKKIIQEANNRCETVMYNAVD